VSNAAQPTAEADPAHAFFLGIVVALSTSVSARLGSGRRGSLAENRSRLVYDQLL